MAERSEAKSAKRSFARETQNLRFFDKKLRFTQPIVYSARITVEIHLRSFLHFSPRKPHSGVSSGIWPSRVLKRIWRCFSNLFISPIKTPVRSNRPSLKLKNSKSMSRSWFSCWRFLLKSAKRSDKIKFWIFAYAQKMNRSIENA